MGKVDVLISGLEELDAQFSDLSKQNLKIKHQLSSIKSNVSAQFRAAYGYANQSFAVLEQFNAFHQKAIASFVKNLEKHHKKELVGQLGEDYNIALSEIQPPAMEAVNPTTGAYIKYKLILKLFVGEDKALISNVMQYLKRESMMARGQVMQMKKEIDEVEAVVSNLSGNIPEEWFALKERFSSLFKYAQEEIELTEDDFEEIGLTLTNAEKGSLNNIIEMWLSTKDKVSEKLDMARQSVDYINTASQWVFDRYDMFLPEVDAILSKEEELLAILKQFRNPINERMLHKETGMSWNSAVAKLEQKIYQTAMMFPPAVGVGFMKMPKDRKEMSDIMVGEESAKHQSLKDRFKNIFDTSPKKVEPKLDVVDVDVDGTIPEEVAFSPKEKAFFDSPVEEGNIMPSGVVYKGPGEEHPEGWRRVRSEYEEIMQLIK